ncbi:MAG: hypothetical protein CL678_01065 [Bdellovibrionaceae bacterium]|nr:hypothetical protein [Pseudobdellovibrionaceae bacterium]|tara:strand:- start:3135 stop:3845 length:711 start_codon:yes stop_codon:yes gene_type:complete
MDRLGSTDPYKALGVALSADDAAVKKAYRLKVLQCHPDKCGDLDEKARAKKKTEFETLTAARDVLLDDEARELYDAKHGKCHRCPYGGLRQPSPLNGGWYPKCTKCQPVFPVGANAYASMMHTHDTIRDAQLEVAQQILKLEKLKEEYTFKKNARTAEIRTLKRKRNQIDRDLNKLHSQSFVAERENMQTDKMLKELTTLNQNLTFQANHLSTSTVYFTPPQRPRRSTAGSRSTAT